MPGRCRLTAWLPAAALALLATGCGSPEASFTRACADRGLAEGTPAMTRCLDEERAAYAAAAARRQEASTRLKGPRGVGIYSSGCYPSPHTGVTC